MKKKKLRNALISSIMSLTLCCVMLIGTTYAWMVDSVTSIGNQIVGGKFDVAILRQKEVEEGEEPEYIDITGQKDDLFHGVNWEPGTERHIDLAVKNEGNLDLKYEIGLILKDTLGSDLGKILEVAVEYLDETNEGVTGDDESDEAQIQSDEESSEGSSDETDKNWCTDEELKKIDEDLWITLSEAVEQGSENISYIVISEESKTLPASNDTENDQEGSLDRFRLHLRVKDVNEVAEIMASDKEKNYQIAQCAMNICVIATQDIENADADGMQMPEVEMPDPVLDDYIYHFAMVEVVPENSAENADESNTYTINEETTDEDAVVYVTSEEVLIQSYSKNVSVTLPEGMRVEDVIENGVVTANADAESEADEKESLIIVSVSPKALTTTLESAESRTEQTLNIQLFGIAEDNETPFELAQCIGKDKRLVQIVYTAAADSSSTENGDGAGTAEEPETVVVYEYAQEEESKEDVIQKTFSKDDGGFGYKFDQESGTVEIQSIHQGDYTIIWEPIDETDDESQE